MAKWTREYINSLPDSAFLFIEDGGEKDEEGKTKPRSLRHLPYKDAEGNVDVPHLRNAIQRAPQIVLSNGEKIGEDAARRIQERARRILERETKTFFGALAERASLAVARFLGTMSNGESEADNVSGKTLAVGGGENGRYTWVARYSNAFRDRDDPPEIITSESHKKFVEAVKSGEAELPELWLLHSEKLRVGKAEWVAFDEKNKIALAGGYFYDFAAPLARHIAKNRAKWRLSHGMPLDSVKKAEDGTIVEHKTVEITLAPATMEANMLTDVVYIGEPQTEKEQKTMDKEAIDALRKQGVPEEVIQAIIEGNAKIASAASKAGIESKTIDAGAGDGENAGAGGDESSAETGEEKALSQKALVEAVAEAIRPYIETVKGIEARLVALEESLADKEEGEEDDEGEMEPKATFAKMLAAALASEAEETAVDGRTKLAKQKPQEAKEKASITSIPWLDEIITG